MADHAIMFVPPDLCFLLGSDAAPGLIAFPETLGMPSVSLTLTPIRIFSSCGGCGWDGVTIR